MFIKLNIFISHYHIVYNYIVRTNNKKHRKPIRNERHRFSLDFAKIIYGLVKCRE